MALPRKKPAQQRYGLKKKAPGLGLRKKLVILGVGFLLVCAALTAVGFLVYKGLSRSDFYQITATNIEGCRRTTKNQILELSGIDVHSNLLAIDLEEVKENIEVHEWVESAEIRREWPNTLTISVRERVPVAIVRLEEGLFYLDQHGVNFAQVLPPEDMDYPVIAGMKRDGWPVSVKDSLLGEALQFIKYAGQGSSILPKQNISELLVDGERELILFLADRPFPIHLGRGNMNSKYHWLARVLYRLYKSKEFAKTAYIKMDYARNKILVGFAGPV